MGERDSEMLNRTYTLNIRSRNDSLAILAYAVYDACRQRDVYAYVLNRVLDPFRAPS